MQTFLLRGPQHHAMTFCIFALLLSALLIYSSAATTVLETPKPSDIRQRIVHQQEQLQSLKQVTFSKRQLSPALGALAPAVVALPSESSTRSTDGQEEPLTEPHNLSAHETPKLHQTTQVPYRWRTLNVLRLFFVIYTLAVIVFMSSRKAQSYLIYLHWIRPPLRWFPLTDLKSLRLSHTGRNVIAGSLRGWHLAPPGPPFPPSFASENEKETYFDRKLSMPRQRVIIFFHGNCGTRAFPPKRVRIIKLLNAQLNAHVVTFDYTGFADSVGHGGPTERSFLSDARSIVQWVLSRVHETTSVFLYGQSLGTFAATHAAAWLSSSVTAPFKSADFSLDGTLDHDTTAGENLMKRGVTGTVLDAPPASLQTAALTHPILLGFRMFGLRPLFRHVIRESLDSTSVVGHIRCPLLVLHGKEDKMIPPWQGRLLADVAHASGNKRVKLIEFENVGHVDVSGADGYLPKLYDFLKRSEIEMGNGPLS